TDDPRFGEFRIGSIPQTGLLASSLPFQTVAGTYSGDLLLNSNEAFVFDDWSTGGPDLNTLDEFDRDLFSVLLHETGNTLGLDDSLLDWTVMYRQYTVPKGILSAEDIAGMRELYGARSDPYEQVSNDQIQVSTLLPTPNGFRSKYDVISTRGSLLHGTDVDHYQFTPVAGQDEVLIRLNARGVSLLLSRVEVLDASGSVIASSDASSVFANDAVVNVSGIADQSPLFIRVSAIDSSSVYAAGDYELEIDYRSESVRSRDSVQAPYDSGPDALFANYSLNDWESDSTRLLLPSSDVYDSGTRFELESAMGGRSDVDVVKFTAPAVIEDRLLIHVAAVDRNLDLDVAVQDSDGQPVGVNGRLRQDGTWALEVAHPEAGKDYFLNINVDPTSSVALGNYVVTADFTALSGQMNQLIHSEGSSAADRYVSWTAAKTKLFRFDLEAMEGNKGDQVKLTVYDAHTGEMRLVMSTQAGMTRTGLAWLTQGDYILRISTSSRFGEPVDALGYSVRCDGVSDDQDDDEEDPDYDTGYAAPTYEYEYVDYEAQYDYDPASYDYYYEP
ncbi:MAG: matrixin family metalloprotease, partial [Rubripirellula sp.]